MSQTNTNNQEESSMARQDRANPDARNFGLRSRDMAMAGQNALKEGMQSYSSIATMSDRFNQFAGFAREELNLRDMRQLEREHVLQYADQLRERCEQGELSPATVQNYLSAVNRVLELARGDRALHVAPVREAGLPQRNGVCTENHRPDVATREQACHQIPERLAVQIDLQRTLGLRFEESCKLNVVTAARQAENQKSVTIIDGTKGGRSRTIPIATREQTTILNKAAQLQDKDRSLIPSHLSYRQYRNQAYQALRETPLSGFHGHRHEYAQNRYEELAGSPCPVVAGIAHGTTHHQYLCERLGLSIQQARDLDHQTRLQVASELGHNRIDITNSYLG